MVGMRMIRRVVPLLSRPLSTTQIRNGSRIPKSSPPLVSLDLPDEWSSNFTHSDSPPPSPKYSKQLTFFPISLFLDSFSSRFLSVFPHFGHWLSLLFEDCATTLEYLVDWDLEYVEKWVLHVNFSEVKQPSFFSSSFWHKSIPFVNPNSLIGWLLSFVS